MLVIFSIMYDPCCRELDLVGGHESDDTIRIGAAEHSAWTYHGLDDTVSGKYSGELLRSEDEQINWDKHSDWRCIGMGIYIPA